MLCTGSGCDRAGRCGLYYRNPQPEHRKYAQLESFAYFGSGSISLEGCDENYWCSPCGDYKMFEPIVDDVKFEILEKQFKALGYNVSTITLKSILEQSKE